MSSNRIQKVALVGASGHVGSAIARSLLSTGQHTVTALTRADSKATFADGIITAKIDYSEPSTIVSVLRGQDALVITLAGFAPPITQSTLIAAAVEAGVRWIFPNEWCPDLAHEGLRNDVPWFEKQLGTREEIERVGEGKTAWIAVASGFWYSYMLSRAYGFDFEKKQVTFFGEGDVAITNSSWPQIGRAVAALLSLPVKPENGDEEKCLERFRNQVVCVSSMLVSQKDMLASVLRVTGTREDEWRITKQPAKERLQEGVEAMKAGNYQDASKVCARIFYPDGCGNVEHKTMNKLLGLHSEDLDGYTKEAIERSKILYP